MIASSKQLERQVKTSIGHVCAVHNQTSKTTWCRCHIRHLRMYTKDPSSGKERLSRHEEIAMEQGHQTLVRKRNPTRLMACSQRRSKCSLLLVSKMKCSWMTKCAASREVVEQWNHSPRMHWPGYPSQEESMKRMKW